MNCRFRCFFKLIIFQVTGILMIPISFSFAILVYDPDEDYKNNSAFYYIYIQIRHFLDISPFQRPQSLLLRCIQLSLLFYLIVPIIGLFGCLQPIFYCICLIIIYDFPNFLLLRIQCLSLFIFYLQPCLVRLHHATVFLQFLFYLQYFLQSAVFHYSIW